MREHADETRDGSMSTRRELAHGALGGTSGVSIEQALLTDQQRLSVVLQGAALLAHLEHGGWILPGGWESARLDDGARLQVPEARRGRSLEPASDQLAQLIRKLFRCQNEVAGRGEARRAARRLLAVWQRAIVGTPGDLAVSQVLEAAPFLFQPAFGSARKCLAAEHYIDGARHPWVAGPGQARRRFLAEAKDLSALEALLAGPRARDLWDGYRDGDDPEDLYRDGRWRRAAAAWARHPPKGWRSVEMQARALFALGRYSEALAVLRRQTRFESKLLKARCQFFLGELNAAFLTLRKLGEGDLIAEQVVALTEVGVRVWGARGQHSEIREWVERSLAEARGSFRRSLRLRAEVVAAGAAWDCNDFEAMEKHLEASREALEDPELAGRWHRARALQAMEVSDGLRVIEHVSAALGKERRSLQAAEAGRLWNDLAVGRVLIDDLAGAERACRHAARLLAESEGPGRTTLVLYNLAEVRLRRGRAQGVAEILERSTSANRSSGNLRGLIRDLELWVRLELVQGRFAAALARCTEARRSPEEPGSADRREVFDVLAARAHGWLGESAVAAALLDRVGSKGLGELEPEERPAVYALAGMEEEALQQAAGTRWAGLWASLVAGVPPAREIWTDVESLEPFRAARLLFDCETLLPGSAPPEAVRAAVGALRQVGAEALAEKLESRSLGAWRALERFFATEGALRKKAVAMLRAAGYGEVRLWLEVDGEEQVWIPGPGGEQALTKPLPGGGSLQLRASRLDTVLQALFAVIHRDVPPPRDEPELRRTRAAGLGGIVGKSSQLTAALDRLDRLARGNLPVLILGESGTGKELVAKRAHLASDRASGPFLPVNCAEISENLIQSDLFGHVRGAFTGADRDRAGVFEAARGGTVFLDEIGDLPSGAQGKLLRVLQEGEIRRLGESFVRKVDVRVVAATHRDLDTMVSGGDFRQDLYFRLKVATIRLPALRDRGTDLVELAEHFLRRQETVRLSSSARQKLLTYDWPGNVRELQNVLEVAAALTIDGEILPEHLEIPEPVGPQQGDYHSQVERFRKGLVKEALDHSNGKQAEAARRLGLTRQALSYLVRQLKIH